MGRPAGCRHGALRVTGGLVALATAGSSLVVLTGLSSLGSVASGLGWPGNLLLHGGAYALQGGGGVTGSHRHAGRPGAGRGSAGPTAPVVRPAPAVLTEAILARGTPGRHASRPAPHRVGAPTPPGHRHRPPAPRPHHHRDRDRHRRHHHHGCHHHPRHPDRRTHRNHRGGGRSGRSGGQ